MNEDTLKGSGRDLTRKVKEAAGTAVGNGSLKGEGIADQLAGKAKKAIGSVKELVAGEAGSTVERFKQFAREKPFATATAIGIVGVALLNTPRGKK
jgi:uncharacterized protein YjbJ (UPF0337 family)